MLICVKLSWFNEVCTLQYIYVLCYDDFHLPAEMQIVFYKL